MVARLGEEQSLSTEGSLCCLVLNCNIALVNPRCYQDIAVVVGRALCTKRRFASALLISDPALQKKSPAKSWARGRAFRLFRLAAVLAGAGNVLDSSHVH